MSPTHLEEPEDEDMSDDLHEIRCEWIVDKGWWSFCLECGEPAWSHPNSDPIADVRASASAVRDGQHSPHPATKQLTPL